MMAYVDPGTGSVIAQVAVAGVAGVAVAVRLGWRRTVSRLRGGEGDVPEEQGPTPDPEH
jgi:hypothetical protein